MKPTLLWGDFKMPIVRHALESKRIAVICGCKEPGKHLAPIDWRLPEITLRDMAYISDFPLVGNQIAQVRCLQEGSKKLQMSDKFRIDAPISRIFIFSPSPVIEKSSILNLDHSVVILMDNLKSVRHCDRELERRKIPGGLLLKSLKLILQEEPLDQPGPRRAQTALPVPSNVTPREIRDRCKLNTEHGLHDWRVSE
jgi:hypothetical protein